ISGPAAPERAQQPEGQRRAPGHPLHRRRPGHGLERHLHRPCRFRRLPPGGVGPDRPANQQEAGSHSRRPGMQLTRRSSRHQTGASLIEVMVSALIVAFGILAMIALQTNALKFNKTSEYRSVATLLANDLADRIRVNPEGAELGQYDLNGEYEALGEAPEPQPCPSSGCSSAQL